MVYPIITVFLMFNSMGIWDTVNSRSDTVPHQSGALKANQILHSKSHCSNKIIIIRV
jgi:hypothetical protein